MFDFVKQYEEAPLEERHNLFRVYGKELGWDWLDDDRNSHPSTVFVTQAEIGYCVMLYDSGLALVDWNEDKTLAIEYAVDLSRKMIAAYEIAAVKRGC